MWFAHNSSGDSNSEKFETKDVNVEKIKQRADILYPKTNVKTEITEISEKINITKSNEDNFEKPANGRISNAFGYRVPPTLGASANHSGTDIAIPVDTP